MLPDSGHIQEQESEWKNKKRLRKGEKTKPPMYTAEDAIRCQEVFEPIKYDEIIDIDEHIHVRFNDAGHMLGSAIIEVWVEENGKKTVSVSAGDLCEYRDVGVVENVSLPFCVRNVRLGDCLLCADGSEKKISDIFSDWHVEAEKKSLIPVIQLLNEKSQRIKALLGGFLGYKDWIVKL